MPLPVRKSLEYTIPLWVRADEAVFFITINCQSRGANQLCLPGIAAPLLDTIRLRHQRGTWWVHLCLLMPDHLHALLSFSTDADMSSTITAWKHYTATQLGLRWQRGFFDHRLRREESLREKVDYILQNPVRKGLVAQADDWPHVWMPG
jgi:REP element-mobilizing transposase RayT